MSISSQLIKHLEDQGATIRKTKKGIMIYGPAPINGSHVMHHTPSDRRNVANDMAALRRIGLTHPLDTRPLVSNEGWKYPDHILLPVTARIEKKSRVALHQMGWPLEVTTSMLSDVVSKSTAEKVLYKIGYRWHPDGKRDRSSKIWVASAEIAKLHEEVLAHPIPEPDVEVKLREQPEGGDRFDSGPVHGLGLTIRESEECTHPSWEDLPGGTRRCEDCREYLPSLLIPRYAPEPEPVEEKAPPLEFIDERDSYVVDMAELFSSVMPILEQKLSVLRAVGLDYELRVWRKKES